MFLLCYSIHVIFTWIYVRITNRREFENMMDIQGNEIICYSGTLSMLSSRDSVFSPLF